MSDLNQTFQSINPATGETVWQGRETSRADCAAAIADARIAQTAWAALPQAERNGVLERYAQVLGAQAEAIASDISRENGKPLWEARTEVKTMVGKVGLSIRALDERAGVRTEKTGFGEAVLRHRPHGIFAVLGPFNFPGHLPNGHIVPALLAGNAVVFKPSEKTPLVGEHIANALAQAGLPQGLFGLVQGGRDAGEALVDQDIDGLLFTGSSKVAALLRARLAARPHIILALELGGNNPLVAWDGDAEAAATIAAESAFISAGQRCSCARRLILPTGSWGDAVAERLVDLSQQLIIGAWDSDPEPFMGPLIDVAAADGAIAAQAGLLKLGAQTLLPLTRPADLGGAFVSPGILDVSDWNSPDDEIFAPLLQITRVEDWPSALREANNTRFGLAAGLISEDDTLWLQFQRTIKAGIVNRNRATIGASGAMPFGGLGNSGNHRASAWYAADYCAYPVASQEAGRVLADGTQIRLAG